jgi:hypothetical protein
MQMIPKTRPQQGELHIHCGPIHKAGKSKQQAHACNPSYSGSRKQEDRGSKPALVKLFLRPYLEKKKSQHKKGLAE